MNSTLFLAINSLAGKNHLLDAIMVFFASYLVYILFLIAVICIAICLYRREWKQAVYFFATLVVSFILLKIAGTFNFDHRPFMDHQVTQLVAHASGKSFPSDHTTVATAIAMGLLYFTRFKKIGVAMLIAAVVIGFSRIFVGIHYPLDILGGLIVGVVGGSVTLLAHKLIASRRLAHEQIESNE